MNCWNPKETMFSMAISSQAKLGDAMRCSLEGSETRTVSPDNKLSLRAPRTHRNMGDDIVHTDRKLFDKVFAFSADDIDKKQADIAFVEKFSDDAGEQMKIAIDSDVLNAVYADANSSNKGTTAGVKSSSYNLGTTASAVAITSSNVLDYIVDCASVLSEQSVPNTERWMVIPTWMANLIKKSDIRDASMTGDAKSVLRNGLIGRIDDFELYVTNNYTAVSDTWNCYNVLFGHKSAITFASQMTNVEKLRNPKTFGDLVRGLNVYGYEVVTPKALGVLYCRKG